MTEPAFPPHEYLTVRELADLLRLKDRKVYDLAASGAVPCSRATGKLLFPAAEIRAWLARSTAGHGTPRPAPRAGLPPILLGSHDPLLDWAIRQSRCGLATFHDGSMDGLRRFLNGEGVAAGLHLYDAAANDWNRPAVADAAAGHDAALIAFATRRRGIVLRSETTAARVAGLADLAGLRIVPRQPESGTDRLFRVLAARDGLDPDALDLADMARTEDEAAEAVARGAAEAAFGLEAAARSFGLRFVPVIEERFALLVDRKAWFDPPLQALLAFCREEPFATRARQYGGYDIAGLGAVLWNA